MRSSLARLILVFSTLALGGCADVNPALEVAGLLAISSPDCVYTINSPATLVISPVLDTFTGNGIAPGGYRAGLMVINRAIVQRNNTYPLMAEPNTFIAQEAEIELRTRLGELINLAGNTPARYRVRATGSINPSTGMQVGQGIVGVEIIPAEFVASLAAANPPGGTVVVSLRLTARSSGGNTQESGAFVFELRLCQGCTYTCSAALDEPELACHLGQDGVSRFPSSAADYPGYAMLCTANAGIPRE